MHTTDTTMDDKMHLLIADVKRLEKEIERLNEMLFIKTQSPGTFNLNGRLIKRLQDEVEQINAKVSQLDESLTRHTRYSTTLRDILNDMATTQKRHTLLGEEYMKKVDKIQEQLDKSDKTEQCSPEAIAFAMWLSRNGYKSVTCGAFWNKEGDWFNVNLRVLYERFKKENGNLK